MPFALWQNIAILHPMVDEDYPIGNNKNGRIFRSGRNANSYSAKPTPRDAT